jgi:hypothetical protein
VLGFPAGNDGSMMPAEKTFLKSIDKKVMFFYHIEVPPPAQLPPPAFFCAQCSGCRGSGSPMSRLAWKNFWSACAPSASI